MLRYLMIKAIATVADLEMPAKQCTITQPLPSRTLSTMRKEIHIKHFLISQQAKLL